MTELRATAAAPLLRLLERLLPVPILLAVLHPVAWVRALVHRGLKGPTGQPTRPVWLPGDAPFHPPLLDRLPVMGDALEVDGWQLEVIEVKERRVNRLLLKPLA